VQKERISEEWASVGKGAKGFEMIVEPDISITGCPFLLEAE
jgi:hypothetical protein